MGIVSCPICNAKLSNSVTICEWCGYIFNRDGHTSFDEIKLRISALIIEGKNLSNPNVLQVFLNKSALLSPIYFISSIILAQKLSDYLYIFSAIFLLTFFMGIFFRGKYALKYFTRLKSNFESEISTLISLYGADNIIKRDIQNFKNDWKNNRETLLKLDV